MIRYFCLEEGKIRPSRGADTAEITWCDIFQPTDNEMINISQKFNVNLEDLEDSVEETTRPRFTYDVVLKNNLLLLHVVKSSEIDILQVPTVTMGLFLTAQGKIITVHSIVSTRFETMIEFVGRQSLKDVYFLYLAITHFFVDQLENLAQKLSGHVRDMQDRILRSKSTKDIEEPFQVNSFLIVFNTSILGDVNALKLFFHKNAGTIDKDLELLEKYNDVQTDIDQVYAFTAIIRDVLANSLDAYGGIINNRLTVVMKMVGSISLILMIPTIIASFYGMNVGVPGGGDPADANLIAFSLIVGLSFFISGVAWAFFRKKRWL